GIAVPGYASLLIVMLLLNGLSLISNGIQGEYIGRIFEEVKGRPLYVVGRTWNLGLAERSEVVGGDPTPAPVSKPQHASRDVLSSSRAVRRKAWIAAAVIAAIAIALVVWRRGGSSDRASGGGDGASGSDDASGTGEGDPWSKRPKAPIHGVAADDDPTIASFGAPAVVEGTVRDSATQQPAPTADVA